jgi:NAD(P)-dependent dehydrogenase (short-subunit alcohol dehydrogenase family)
LFYLHLTFADHLIRELKVLNYESSLIFCSSLMAYVPDRIFPSYAASKAGLNQLILSSIPNVPSKLKISGINLGPVAKNPSHWFETTPLQVTQKIDKLLKAKTCGLIFYPRIGKLLAFLSIVHPFILEKLLIGRRRPHG